MSSFSMPQKEQIFSKRCQVQESIQNDETEEAEKHSAAYGLCKLKLKFVYEKWEQKVTFIGFYSFGT